MLQLELEVGGWGGLFWALIWLDTSLPRFCLFPLFEAKSRHTRRRFSKSAVNTTPTEKCPSTFILTIHKLTEHVKTTFRLGYRNPCFNSELLCDGHCRLFSHLVTTGAKTTSGRLFAGLVSFLLALYTIISRNRGV